MSNPRMAASRSGMHKILRKASERKSPRKQATVSSRDRVTGSMKEKIWRNWLMEENYL